MSTKVTTAESEDLSVHGATDGVTGKTIAGATVPKVILRFANSPTFGSVVGVVVGIVVGVVVGLGVIVGVGFGVGMGVVVGVGLDVGVVVGVAVGFGVCVGVVVGVAVGFGVCVGVAVGFGVAVTPSTVRTIDTLIAPKFPERACVAVIIDEPILTREIVLPETVATALLEDENVQAPGELLVGFARITLATLLFLTVTSSNGPMVGVIATMVKFIVVVAAFQFNVPPCRAEITTVPESFTVTTSPTTEAIRESEDAKVHVPSELEVGGSNLYDFSTIEIERDGKAPIRGTPAFTLSCVVRARAVNTPIAL